MSLDDNIFDLSDAEEINMELVLTNDDLFYEEEEEFITDNEEGVSENEFALKVKDTLLLYYRLWSQELLCFQDNFKDRALQKLDLSATSKDPLESSISQVYNHVVNTIVIAKKNKGLVVTEKEQRNEAIRIFREILRSKRELNATPSIRDMYVLKPLLDGNLSAIGNIAGGFMYLQNIPTNTQEDIVKADNIFLKILDNERQLFKRDLNVPDNIKRGISLVENLLFKDTDSKQFAIIKIEQNPFIPFRKVDSSVIPYPTFDIMDEVCITDNITLGEDINPSVVCSCGEISNADDYINFSITNKSSSRIISYFSINVPQCKSCGKHIFLDESVLSQLSRSLYTDYRMSPKKGGNIKVNLTSNHVFDIYGNKSNTKKLVNIPIRPLPISVEEDYKDSVFKFFDTLCSSFEDENKELTQIILYILKRSNLIKDYNSIIFYIYASFSDDLKSKIKDIYSGSRRKYKEYIEYQISKTMKKLPDDMRILNKSVIDLDALPETKSPYKNLSKQLKDQITEEVNVILNTNVDYSLFKQTNNNPNLFVEELHYSRVGRFVERYLKENDLILNFLSNLVIEVSKCALQEKTYVQPFSFLQFDKKSLLNLIKSENVFDTMFSGINNDRYIRLKPIVLQDYLSKINDNFFEGYKPVIQLSFNGSLGKKAEFLSESTNPVFTLEYFLGCDTSTEYLANNDSEDDVISYTPEQILMYAILKTFPIEGWKSMNSYILFNNALPPMEVTRDDSSTQKQNN